MDKSQWTEFAPVLSAAVTGFGGYLIAKLRLKKSEREILSQDQFKFIDELKEELRLTKEELRQSRVEIAELREEVLSLRETNIKLVMENKQLQEKVSALRDEIKHIRGD